MNWEAIGAIGEVLGAAGVIITLAYLAVQIRQNSRPLSANNDETPELQTITVGRWKVYLDDGREDEARDGSPGRCGAGRGA